MGSYLDGSFSFYCNDTKYWVNMKTELHAGDESTSILVYRQNKSGDYKCVYESNTSPDLGYEKLIELLEYYKTGKGT